MPRKRKGWGNPDSLRFPALGYAKPPQYKAVGQIQSSNQFGSTITRSVTEHYDLNTDWKAWRRGYEIYAHGKFKQSDFTLKFKQYEGTSDETTVYLRFYEYPTNVSDSGNRTVTIRYTDILNAGAGGDDTGFDFDYRTGLTNVFQVKNSESDYSSRAEYLQQKEKGHIPVVLNKYNNPLLTQVRRAQPGSRLTDGYYSGNLIDLEDKNGLPVRLYGRTYKNLKLEGNDQNTRELENRLNKSSYKYKIKREDFLRLSGESTALAAKDWNDDNAILQNLVGKLAVPLSFWNDFAINVNSNHEGLALKEKRFGEIYNVDLDVSLFRFFKIYDIESFPNTVYNQKDFKVLFETLKIGQDSGVSQLPPDNQLPINNETDPENGSAEVNIESHYIFINSEYKRFYKKAATKEQLDEIYRQVTTASLTIEAANVIEVIDHRKEASFNYLDNDQVWLTIVCSPPKQEIQLFRPFDATDNTVVGIFDANSFSYKAWSNGDSFFDSYTSNQFKKSLNPKQLQETGFIELKIDPWSYKHHDMWQSTAGFKPLLYDLLFSCSCPGYTHSLAKSPETTGVDRKTKSNRQEKYPLPGALSRALTSDGDEDSVAGNAIQWLDSRYETSFKNCKHTIAAMYEFGLQVREPDEIPTENNREKFLEKLYEEREQFDYLKVNPGSVQRGEISNFDIGLSMLNSVNIPSTNPSRLLETPDAEVETAIIPVTTNTDVRSPAQTETVRQIAAVAAEAEVTNIPVEVVTVEDVIEVIEIEEADPEFENTHQPVIDFGNTKRLVNINPALPGGLTEWDFPTKGDLQLLNTLTPAGSVTPNIYNFRVLDEITISAELYGAGGASGSGMITRYWPYEPSVSSDHTETNEEEYYRTNNKTAVIDSTASEQDSNYTSAATVADTNYYEGYGGVAKGKLTLTPGKVYKLYIGQTGQINATSTFGGGSTEIRVPDSNGNEVTALIAGGGGSASLRKIGSSPNFTYTYLSPGGHGGFGTSGNGSDGVQGFREDLGNTPINPGKGATTTANGSAPTALHANDLTAGLTDQYRQGEGGSGRFDGSAGLANNGSPEAQRGASGGGGGSSFGDPAYVSEISYQGTPLNAQERGKLIIKTVDD